MSPPHVQESTPSIADETTPDGVIPGNIRADATDIADDMTPVARECDNWRRQLIARGRAYRDEGMETAVQTGPRQNDVAMTALRRRRAPL
jgi:hypothetical protein